MICTVAITIVLFGEKFYKTVELYGKVVEFRDKVYVMDFSKERPELNRLIQVPRELCEKG